MCTISIAPTTTDFNKMYIRFYTIKGKTQEINKTEEAWRENGMLNKNDERYRWRIICFFFLFFFLSVQCCLEMLRKLYCYLLLFLHHSLCFFLHFLPLLFHGTLLPLCHLLLPEIHKQMND